MTSCGHTIVGQERQATGNSGVTVVRDPWPAMAVAEETHLGPRGVRVWSRMAGASHTRSTRAYGRSQQRAFNCRAQLSASAALPVRCQSASAFHTICFSLSPCGFAL